MKSLTLKFIFPLAALMAVALGCNAFQSTQAAESAVEEFHKLYNDSQYDKIYDNGGSDFKEAITKDDWVKLLSGAKKKLGKVVNAKRNGWHVNKDLSGTTVTVTYEVQFEEAKGKEQFIFRGDGDDLRLLRWDVSSPALAIK